ncbi:hypothetical protein FE257_006207 [Aspergillus nanangensis]|uniref:Uncharacterized protein n=1 Tax=Aspergillus nanangensis TaxID=2582783 RepID=A0AAD4GUZ7_ASPNN|nr:hypothetical protein FE257_006207 [Aspergillus nanangensis]
MVIDLTQDSDPEDQFHSHPPQIKQQTTKDIRSFFFSPQTSRLHHSPQSLVPLKRRQESIQLQSHIPHPQSGIFLPSTSGLNLANGSTITTNYKTNHQNGRFTSNLHPSTPSPGPEATAAHLKAIEVVIPSPSRKLQTEIEAAHWTRGPDPEALTGLSEKIYPIDATEKRALKGAYQVSKRVNRKDIPFTIGTPGSILKKRPRLHNQLRETLNRKLSKIKGPSVTFPEEDESAILNFAANFEFINSYKLGKGVVAADSAFDSGCSCGAICDPARCLCLDTEEGGNSDAEPKKILPYEYYDKKCELLVLTEQFLKRTSMILECGQLCDCDRNTCWNRVVQRGRTIRLEIFTTSNRGFGLRSPDPIYAGQFIDRYLGEVITKEVADIREELAFKQGHSYLFGLDFFPEINEAEIYVVDGQKFGSTSRFMNHSCNPNCKMFPVSHTHHDRRLYDLAFFASRDIPPNVELTFDYNPGAKKEVTSSIDPAAVRCLCGERNCRGQLWPNQRKGTK